jgi:3-oxoacyl-[acyl-carrier protein] reductase
VTLLSLLLRPEPGRSFVPEPRRALVTGANRGIGRLLALGLAAAGHDLAVLGRRPEAVATVTAECTGLGVRAVPVVADVVVREQVAAAIAEAEAHLGGIDLLVNNAGVLEPADRPFAEIDVETSWHVVEVNVRGPMLVTHAVLPGMLARGVGRIVNLNSGAGYRSMGGYTGYSVSKGALARFTSQLDAQYRDRGIASFDVAPGHIETEMTRGMPMHAGRTDWTPPEALLDLVLGIADGRLDRLSGRFFRAGTDTTESLLLAQDEILVRDARALRLTPIAPDDPIR